MTFQDDIEGTGMGEGQGKKDVSDEIDDEDQLLGLKDDKPKEKNDSSERKELKEDEKDKGIEMSQDFDGELFDLPDEQEGDQDQEEEEDEDDELEDDVDREMGDAGDADIVDEKQWDSDDDGSADDEGGEEKFEDGSKMSGETLKDEMHSKGNSSVLTQY